MYLKINNSDSTGWKGFVSLTLLLLYSFVTAVAQEPVASKGEKSWRLSGYVKDMGSFVTPRTGQKWITNNLFHNRNNFRWNISNSFTFGLEERNRFYAGDLYGNIPEYMDFIAYDNGLVNLSWNISEGNSHLFNASIDRLWLDFTHEKLQVTLGRQRINWSQTFVWNPNDLFNTYSYFDFDYEEKPGSDALRLQYFSSPSSRAEITMKADHDRKVTVAGLYRFNRWSYDFQWLAGFYRQRDLVVGLGWSGQIVKGGFRGELTGFRSLENISDSSWVFLASVAYDYTFRNSLFIQFEGFYNSNSTNSLKILVHQFNSSLLDAKNPFLNGVSLFYNIAYPLSPLVSLSFATIYNPSNRIYFLLPTVTWSLLNNLDLSVISQTFHTYDPSLPDQSQTSLFARLKYAF
jgi:hypothetical protein